MGGLFARIVLVVTCLTLMAALATLGSPSPVGQASQATPALGIDADATGNGDTSLGNIDACVSVAPGQTFDVDIFVADAVDLVTWEAVFDYDPSLLRVTETNEELFMAAGETGRLIDLSDLPPDEDGFQYFLVVAITPEGLGRSGTGVLARVTLEAVATGTSFLTLTNLILGDSNSKAIGDLNGDDEFDGTVGHAQVWVGEPCPAVLPSPTAGPPTLTPEVTPEATPPTTAAPSSPTATLGPGQPTATPGGQPSPQPTATPSGQPSPQATPSDGGDDNGFPWAVVVGGAAATLVAAVAAALIFRWLLRRAG